LKISAAERGSAGSGTHDVTSTVKGKNLSYGTTSLTLGIRKLISVL
jgi:hypothetical protein